MDEWEGASLALLRQGLYRILGASFRYPEAEPLGIVADTSSRLEVRHLASFTFYPHWLRLTQALQDLPLLGDLQTEYVRLFSPGPGGALCSAYESAYLDLEVQPASFNLALEQEYRHLGLSVSGDYRDLPDHVSAEMEAMALLCGMEAAAWRSRLLEEAHRILRDETGFLQRHLGRWLPRLDERIRSRAKVPFYAVLADAADGFTLHDLDLLQVIAQEVAS